MASSQYSALSQCLFWQLGHDTAASHSSRSFLVCPHLSTFWSRLDRQGAARIGSFLLYSGGVQTNGAVKRDIGYIDLHTLIAHSLTPSSLESDDDDKTDLSTDDDDGSGCCVNIADATFCAHQCHQWVKVTPSPGYNPPILVSVGGLPSETADLAHATLYVLRLESPAYQVGAVRLCCASRQHRI